MMEFYTAAIYKAKKEHVCHICNETIHKGQLYEYESGKYEGDFFSRKSHIPCAKARDEYLATQEENEYEPWAVLEYMKSKEEQK